MCLVVTLPVHNWNQGCRGCAEVHLAPKLVPSLMYSVGTYVIWDTV